MKRKGWLERLACAPAGKPGSAGPLPGCLRSLASRERRAQALRPSRYKPTDAPSQVGPGLHRCGRAGEGDRRQSKRLSASPWSEMPSS